jgi:hypothetical protein
MHNAYLTTNEPLYLVSELLAATYSWLLAQMLRMYHCGGSIAQGQCRCAQTTPDLICAQQQLVCMRDMKP